MITEPFYTTDEVARRLHVTRTAVAWWCREGKLPAFRIGRRWLIKQAAFDALLAERGG